MSTLADLLLPEPPEPGASFRYGSVTGTSPLRVRLDGDANAVSATPTTLAQVIVGDRVLVLLYHRRMVIVGVVGSPGDIVTGGVRYESSGVFDAVTPGAWVVSSSPVYATQVNLSVPFTPPTGWGFDVHVLAVARYATVNVMSQSSSTISIGYTQFGNATQASTVFGWTLVRTS